MSSPQPDHAAALQSILASLGVLTVAQLVDLFNNYGGGTGFAGLLHTAVPEIVGQHAQAAATVTAQWYDELAPDLPFQAAPVVDLPPVRIAKSIDWALRAPGPESLKPEPGGSGLTTLTQAPDTATTLSRLSGSAKRMVYDAGRDTVIQNAGTEGVRWARYASATACEFCKLLAIRGPVYTSQQSALKAHDHCRCIAVPERAGEPYAPPDYTHKWQKQYEDARTAVGGNFKAILAHMRANTDAASDGKRSSPAPRVEPKPAHTETKGEIAARHLPALEKSLAELRAKGLPEDSPQIQYHLKQIAKFRSV